MKPKPKILQKGFVDPKKPTVININNYHLKPDKQVGHKDDKLEVLNKKRVTEKNIDE